ncbi:MAG TPA: restriction endonuclease [Lentimicrobium sp.]|nr:restriction endonuclease [Lentimicrobium sp.]
MNYPGINIQGNIISGEILEKIWNEDTNHQTPASFGLDKNIRVRDEIGLAWSTIRGLWQTFSKRRERIDPEESGTSETRNFWMLPFLATLGYDVEKANAELIDGKTYAISHRAMNIGEFPIHIAGINDSLDRRRDNSGPRLSPHALVQEYLNKTEDHLYALITNGIHLRLLRDATRLVRQAYLEFNLEKMMEEELFADFAVLYRALHATRMPRQKGEGETSIIEIYHQESLEAGSRIREKLSEAVEFSIKQMANGFLKHPENEMLREVVAEGTMSADAFYLHSLRLIYRVLFLLVIEDRGLVFPDKGGNATKKQRETYFQYYSISHLRQIASRRIFVDGNKHDLWESLKVTFRLFEEQQSAQKLGLQALGSGIFEPGALGVLSHSIIDNAHLLEMMHRLSFFRDDERRIWVKVNYSDLDVEEFGSVYEGLLEYQPVFTDENSMPGFSFEKGDARSKSGSHYTPEELVRPLIKHSLDYIIDDCLKKPQERLKNLPANLPLKVMQEKALQAITVCDVACGSGHILLSAARRIATELAKVRTGEDQPSPAAMRSAMRDTIKTCIYGVDKNPLAVELCKVALWLEAHNPGEPLNFLDHHIKCGDSIVGLAHRSELENGIADEAFKTLPGDDKEVAKTLRDQNTKERREREARILQLKVEFEKTTASSVQEAITEYRSFNLLPETTPDEIERKAKAYKRFIEGKGFTFLKAMADTQVAQFFIPKTFANKDLLITDADYREILSGHKGWQDRKIAKATAISLEKRFFHWFLEFPEVFGEGGFDCILGNPPFLGGQKLSGSFGDAFLESIKYQYAPIGAVDLVTYFYRRIFTIIKQEGFQSLISTNTIAQGKVRENGLDIITQTGGTINHAVKSTKWPGVAAVEVALVTITRQTWKGKFYLGTKEVKTITPYLDDAETLGNPFPLKQNEGKSFQGSIVLGKGFVLEPHEAEALIGNDPRNKDVLFPYLNGEDLNNNPNQSPSRWVINFFDWLEEKARIYPDCFKIIERLVKPERQRWALDKEGNEIIGEYALRKPLPEKWWIYGEKRPALYQAIAPLERVMVICRVTKYVKFSFSTSKVVFSDATNVFMSGSILFFTLLENSIHDHWAWKASSTMGGTTLRYSPSDCFETFPFPRTTEQQQQQLENIGESYHEHRKQLMLSIQLGLTKTYNAFHAKEIQTGITTEALQSLNNKDIEKQYGKEVWNLWNHLQKTPDTCSIEEAIAGIVKLRELHVEMDNAVLEAYGWAPGSSDFDSAQSPGRPAIDLRHDFYEVDYLPENDRVRFTIHPDARKEILKRLLELNHKIFEQEAREGLHKEETVRKFYEQKGIPVPIEVSKWFKKGKAYKTKKSRTPKAGEPEGGYGDLFG